MQKVRIVRKVRKVRTIAVVAAAVVMLSGCETPQRILTLMDTAERNIDSLPVEAYESLRTVRRRHLRSPEDRARYALLFAQVEDKNDIKFSSDSLISIAVRYYGSVEDSGRQAKSYYYLARVYEDTGRDSLALSASVTAQRLAAAAGDWHIAGLTASTFGRFYEKQQLFPQAAEAYTLAVDAFERAGERRNLMYVYLNRSSVYSPMLEYDRAIADDSMALELATELCDTVWFDEIYSSLAKDIFHKTEIPQPSLDILRYNYRTYRNGEPPIWDYSILYQLYEAMGQPDSAMYYLNLDFENRDLYPLEAQPGLYILMSQAAAKRGDYVKALEYREIESNLSDSIFRMLQQQSVIEIEEHYRNDLLKEENATLVAQRKATASIFVAILIVIAATSITILLRNRYRQSAVREIIRDKNEYTRTLSLAYYQSRDNIALQSKIVDIVAAQFNDHLFDDLERSLNLIHNGVITTIRAEFPGINEQGIKYVILICADFSPQEISVIMNVSLDAAYRQRNRYRERIQKSKRLNRAQKAVFFSHQKPAVQKKNNQKL